MEEIILNDGSELLPATQVVDSYDLQSLSNEDDEVIKFYLAQKNDNGQPAFSSRTIESYKRDLKRLRMYLDMVGRSFRDITVRDVEGFVDWLASPGQDFIGKHRYPVTDKRWKAFYKKGLSLSSMRQQMASVRAFFSWLMNTGYIEKNVFALQKKSKAPGIKVERHLRNAELRAVNDYLTTHEHNVRSKREKAALARKRWLWYAYILSGLRISELLTITGADLSRGAVWTVSFVGKGRTEPEKITVPDLFIEELQRYRVSLGLSLMPNKYESLLLSITGKHSITDRSSAHRIFKDLVNQAADHLKMKKLGLREEELSKNEDPDDVLNIRRASVHWLRHGFVTGLLEYTTDIATVSKMARHRDMKTTSGYSHAEEIKQHKILNEFAEGFK